MELKRVTAGSPLVTAMCDVLKILTGQYNLVFFGDPMDLAPARLEEEEYKTQAH